MAYHAFTRSVCAVLCTLLVAGAPAGADVICSRINPSNGHSYYLIGTHIGGGLYDGMTWADAQAQAVLLGGNLATINDAGENSWVWNVFSIQPRVSNFWIGINDLSAPGVFQWASGQSPAYTNWSPGEPNNIGFERCGEMWSPQGTWNNEAPSSAKLGVVELTTGVNRFDWNKPGGGSFAVPQNWTPSGPPAVGGAAYFAIAGAYTVSFPTDAATTLAVVEAGSVTFDLTGQSYATYETFVAHAAGQSAMLTVSGGNMNCGYGTVGADAGSSGTLRVLDRGTFEAANGMFVGNMGTGSLDVGAGGTFNANDLCAGLGASAVGTVAVGGLNAELDVAGELVLGDKGQGSMLIGSQGQATANFLTLGKEAGSQGTLTVIGTEASLTAYEIAVGNGGNGWAMITGGASVATTQGHLGILVAATGEVEVSGGASWTNSGEIFIGHNGSAKLTITGGGHVESNGMRVGWNPLGRGELVVSGDGSTLAMTGSGWLSVSEGGFGRMIVKEGAAVTATSSPISIGDDWLRWGSGEVLVTGAGSSMSTGNFISVGRLSYGLMGVTDGGTVSCGTMAIGDGAGSYGELTVDGGGSQIDVAGELSVAYGGVGSLLIGGGAAVSVNDTAFVGREGGALGDVKISGAGSVLTAGSVLVGDFGNGHVIVQDGGSLVSGDSVFIGGGSASTLTGPETMSAAIGGIGSITVTGNGSTLVANSLLVGWVGSGSLAVVSGAQVSASWASIGDDASAMGYLDVAGPGTVVSLSGDLRVGARGQGSLAVFDGAVVATHGTMEVGADDGSYGAVSISGAGSELHIFDGWLSLRRGNLYVSGEVIADEGVWITEGTAVIDGGTVQAGNGLWLDSPAASIFGYGQIVGSIRGYGSGITALGGRLVLGDMGSPDGFNFDGPVAVDNDATLELLDQDMARLPGGFALTNGVIIARNGLDADNAPTGYGIVVGPATRGITSPTGCVQLTQALDVGSSIARVYSTGQAGLGHVTTISGGILIAPRGVYVGPESFLTGYGTISGNILLGNSLLWADGGTLAISGALSGYGVVVGDVTAWTWPICSPSAAVQFAGLGIGDRTAVVYSAGLANLGNAQLTGGRIIAQQGLLVDGAAAILGHGTIESDVHLANGLIRALGGTLTLSGTLEGFGFLVGDVSCATASPPSGPALLSSPINIGAQNMLLYSAGQVELEAEIIMAGGTISGQASIWTWSQGLIRGCGTINVDVEGNGVLPEGGTLTFNGTWTMAYGNVSGSAVAPQADAVNAISLAYGNVSGSAIAFGPTGRLLGDGVIDAEVSSAAGSSITVAHEQLEIGKGSSTRGVNLGGKLIVADRIVSLHDADMAELSGEVSMLGGTMSATNGLNVASSGLIYGRGVIQVGASAATGLTNSGTIAFSGTTDVLGKVRNMAGGHILASGGQPVTFWDDVVNSGQIDAGINTTVVYYGSVSGSGTFTGSGTSYLAGDLHPGSSPGRMSFGGNVILGPSASLQVEVLGPAGGTQFDVLEAGGTAYLDGTLQIVLLPGARFRSGVIFRIVDSAGRAGEFDDILMPLLPNGQPVFSVAYTPVAVELISRSGVSSMGDADCDAFVDDDDLSLLLSNWKGGDVGWEKGDFNFSTDVDDDDLSLLLSNWTGSGGGSIPEPATLCLLTLGGLGMLRRRRRP